MKASRLTLLVAALLLPQAGWGAEPANTGTVCWYQPKNTSAGDKARLATSLAESMSATKPAHVDYMLERIKSKAHAATLNCLAIIDVTKSRDYARTKEITFKVEKANVAEPIFDRSFVLDLRTAPANGLAAFWTELWPKLAPPPPPPPPPPPVAAKPFVDEELKAAQAAEAVVEPDGPPLGRLVSVFAGLGLFSRSLDETAPGRPLDQGGALSIGADAIFHGAELLRLSDGHDIDLDLGYAYRFVAASDEDAVGVSADRLNLGAAYRYQLPGAYLPRVGALLGYELLRNELSESGGAYSVRYSVMRLGLSISEPIAIDEHMNLRAFFDVALRLAPGAEGADAAASFDIGGGVALHFDRFLVRARIRHAQQSLEANGASFSDRFLDLDLGLGFQL